ncbi:uncharacterized protein LAJ45_00144 [Morchella importuna]|uniref:uncharacterized protein n=1 Tax=Morchella importuna TaxID=1174673 RepID=UPI001E8E4674|nr:uncharacterized protein LAJ45_00144 [Morchella importuna]KAH8155135.1 hypothetical protein LAJ45_00144 [Morchella importuna]
MSNTQPEDEEALVKARVLAHEARPYNRLVKRCSSLTTPDTPLTPDAAARLRDDIDTDFKYFESVITRIQLLKDTNRREVERYEKEKGDILETASTARSTLISLRTTLQKTQNEKANKLLYDAIATDILRTGASKRATNRRLVRSLTSSRRCGLKSKRTRTSRTGARACRRRRRARRWRGPGWGVGVEGCGGWWGESGAATPAGMTPSVGAGAEEEMEEGEESEEGVGAEGDVEVGDADVATQREGEREEGEEEEGEEEEREEGEEGEEGEKMVVEEEEVDKMDIDYADNNTGIEPTKTRTQRQPTLTGIGTIAHFTCVRQTRFVFPTPVQTSIHIDPETKLTPTPHRISIDPIPSTHPTSARRTPRYLRRCTTRRARPQRASTAGIAALSFREGFLWSVL